MMKLNDEYKRKVNEEDKHTLKIYESLLNLVRKLEWDMVALKGRKEGIATSTAVASS